MNRAQMIVLWIGIGLIVAMILFPPWTAYYGRAQYRDQGYSGIADPPDTYCHVNSSRLFLQCLPVAIIGAGLMLTLRKRKEK